MAVYASRSYRSVFDDRFVIYLHGRMALFARHADVLAGQGKIRLGIVVKYKLFPDLGGVTSTAMGGAVERELPGVRVLVAGVTVSFQTDILHRLLGIRGPLVTRRTSDSRMLSAQRKTRLVMREDQLLP